MGKNSQNFWPRLCYVCYGIIKQNSKNVSQMQCCFLSIYLKLIKSLATPNGLMSPSRCIETTRSKRTHAYPQSFDLEFCRLIKLFSFNITRMFLAIPAISHRDLFYFFSNYMKSLAMHYVPRCLLSRIHVRGSGGGAKGAIPSANFYPYSSRSIKLFSSKIAIVLSYLRCNLEFLFSLISLIL